MPNGLGREYFLCTGDLSVVRRDLPADLCAPDFTGNGTLTPVHCGPYRFDTPVGVERPINRGEIAAVCALPSSGASLRADAITQECWVCIVCGGVRAWEHGHDMSSGSIGTVPR